MSGDLNLPYEPVGGDPIEMTVAGTVCGGLAYRAAVIDTPSGPMPSLVWDFWRADGQKLAPIILVVAPEQMLRLPDELRKAIRDVVKASR